ncbi:hypothetical protein [Pseudomonas sp. NPDC089406]|uniref:hypothetical protein n=1 Tax=Pseudomonas sp. NPDC089406 TaxID=3364463 RepID=UPI00384C5F4F
MTLEYLPSLRSFIMTAPIYPSVENFERSELTTFEKGMTYKTSSNAKHSFELTIVEDGATPSGIMSTELLGMGAKVLVVGDQSAVRLDFGEKVTNVSWNYCVVIDYTEEDLNAEHPDLVGTVDVTKLTALNFSEDFLVEAIPKEAIKEPDLSDDPGVHNKSLGTAIVTALIFKTSRVGSLQIDSIRWEKVPD